MLRAVSLRAGPQGKHPGEAQPQAPPALRSHSLEGGARGAEAPGDSGGPSLPVSRAESTVAPEDFEEDAHSSGEGVEVETEQALCSPPNWRSDPDPFPRTGSSTFPSTAPHLPQHQHPPTVTGHLDGIKKTHPSPFC